MKSFKKLILVVFAVLVLVPSSHADITLGIIDPGITLDPGIFIGPILPLDPCFSADFRFELGTVTKYDELTEAGVYRATATATLTSDPPGILDGFVRQTEVASITGGALTWNSQDIFIFPGLAWVTGESFARNTLSPQTGDNSYWGITKNVMMEATNAPADLQMRYIFDNFGGDVEVCFFILD